MKKYYLLLALMITLSACSPVKKILHGGSLQQTSYLEKIPFTFDYGIPFITVNINGKDYNFMFDTGAPTVITPELAQVLNLKPLASERVSDSQGTTNREQYVLIPSIKIGELSFEKTGALIMVLDNVFEFKCMKFDGIIGANLMAKALWEIDYQHKVITATNDLGKLTIPADANTIPFFPKRWQRTPLIPVQIGAKSYYTTFDTGSNGDFTLDFNTYKAEISGFKSIESIGGVSAGVYGKGKNSLTRHVKVPLLAVGGISLTDQIIDFKENSPVNIGNLFLKHYRVVLDWNQHKIYMIRESTFNETKLQTFGLGLSYVNNKPKVSVIYRNSEAEKLGILINDELIAVNGKDFANLSTAEACFYAFNSIFKTPETSLNLAFLREGKKIDFTVKKTTLLE